MPVDCLSGVGHKVVLPSLTWGEFFSAVFPPIPDPIMTTALFFCCCVWFTFPEFGDNEFLRGLNTGSSDSGASGVKEKG